MIFIYRAGKRGALIQADYLVQVLEPYIGPILEAFTLIIYILRPSVDPLFIEDSNPVYGYKSTTNYYTRYYIKYGIVLIPYPSTSPNIKPIKKY